MVLWCCEPCRLSIEAKIQEVTRYTRLTMFLISCNESFSWLNTASRNIYQGHSYFFGKFDKSIEIEYNTGGLLVIYKSIAHFTGF
jgi:hypothetical protein